VLLSRGCLWNTFVTIGYASTFLELIRSQVPNVTDIVAAGIAVGDLGCAYHEVRSVDFCREVLAPLPHRLLTVRDVASGWTDLGTPDRVIDTLLRNGIEPGWLEEVRFSPEVLLGATRRLGLG
jgi:hypothetical protein